MLLLPERSRRQQEHGSVALTSALVLDKQVHKYNGANVRAAHPLLAPKLAERFLAHEETGYESTQMSAQH